MANNKPGKKHQRIFVKCTDELVTVVDQNDRVIGRAKYYEVIRKKSWKRIAGVIIKNSSGKILLQLKSKLVRNPLTWTFSASGRVSYGESYIQAARKELEEELGIRVPIKKLVKGKYAPSKVHYTIYIGKYDGPFRPNREVRQVKFCSYPEIKQMMRHSPAQFRPSVIDFFKRHMEAVKRA